MAGVAGGSVPSGGGEAGRPVRVGPFRLVARLGDVPAGVVFLGEDDAGRRVSVAVLNRGAAADAAARDRFRAAISAGLPGAGAVGVRGYPGDRAMEGGAGDPSGGAAVVAAEMEGPAPWVATLYEADRGGAERFLEPVRLGAEGHRHGPGFAPHWAGSGEPALPEPRRVPLLPGRRGEGNLLAAVVMLVAVLLVLGLLLAGLAMCEREPEQVPPPPTPQEPQFPQPPPPPLPSPSPTSPSPSPSETSPGPSPSQTESGEPGGEGGDGGPL